MVTTNLSLLEVLNREWLVRYNSEQRAGVLTRSPCPVKTDAVNVNVVVEITDTSCPAGRLKLYTLVVSVKCEPSALLLVDLFKTSRVRELHF